MMINLIYQVWPISWIEPQFKGDNRSALRKIIDFLPRISNLGAKYLWLSPIFSSPWRDHGYDVKNYRTIDSRFGSMKEFEELVKKARDYYGIKILMDLVLNHTSIEHQWFDAHPEYYCRSSADKPGWQNLFDNKSCWEYDKKRGDYYLHLFDKTQADLNWFPNGLTGKPNQELAREFQDIVDFWVNKGIAGFRLDAMQCINKNPASDKFDPFATATEEYRQLAAKVMNAIFNETREDLYLLMECLDLNGEMVRYYYENTPVNAVMDNTPVNTLSITEDRSVTERSLEDYISAVRKVYETCPGGYAHVTESHDCPRFTTAAGVDGKDALDILFGLYKGKRFILPYTIVIYQGQELGLGNPSAENLPNQKMVELDAQTKMRFERGESLDDLRLTSRANARVAIPMEEYRKQEKKNISSCLSYCEILYYRWMSDYAAP